jgi:hypothetical protein
MYYRRKDHQISQRCQSNFDALLQMRSAYSVAKQRGVSLEKVLKEFKEIMAKLLVKQVRSKINCPLDQKED